MSPTVEPVDGWPFPFIEADYHQGREVWREVTEEHYYYALEVLPPLDWGKYSFLVSEPLIHERDGVAVYAAFAKINGRFFARNLRRDLHLSKVAELVGVVT